MFALLTPIVAIAFVWPCTDTEGDTAYVSLKPPNAKDNFTALVIIAGQDYTENGDPVWAGHDTYIPDHWPWLYRLLLPETIGFDAITNPNNPYYPDYDSSYTSFLYYDLFGVWKMKGNLNPWDPNHIYVTHGPDNYGAFEQQVFREIDPFIDFNDYDVTGPEGFLMGMLIS